MHRQVVIAGPSDLRIEDQDPPLPGVGELLIYPDAVGICGTDVELLAGTMGYVTAGKAKYPIVPGHEWTGVVAAVGAGVAVFSIGDRVVGECSIGCGMCGACRAGSYHLCPYRTETGILNRMGGMASAFIFPAVSAHLVAPAVDRLDAALIEPLSVAYRGLHLLSTEPVGPVAIVGAGPIGLLCAMTARALGMGPVLIVDRVRSRSDFAASLGFDTAAVAPHAVGQVIDASGTPSGTTSAIRLASDGGRIVVLGLSGRPTMPVDLDDIVLRDLTLTGSNGSPNIWPEAVELVNGGLVRPSVIISHRFPLSDAPKAFAAAGEGSTEARKIVVNPQSWPNGQRPESLAI